MIIVKSEEDIKNVENDTLRNFVDKIYTEDMKGAIADYAEYSFADMINYVLIEKGEEMFAENIAAHIRPENHGVFHAAGNDSFVEYIDEYDNFYTIARILSDDGFGIVYVLPKSLEIPITSVMRLCQSAYTLEINRR